MTCARHMADCTDKACPTHGNPAEVLRSVAVQTAQALGLEVDHDRFDQAAAYCAEPVEARPAAPSGTDNVWYRGWEVGYDADADFWSNEGWIAYKGGCDLGAPEVRSATYEACLDLIDDEEDD